MDINVDNYSSLLQAKMEVYKVYFILVTIIFLTFSTMAAADDFDTARQKINQAKPDIDYTTFCSERGAGGDKIACRIKDVPSVGFLVCKTPVFKEGEEVVNCSDVIRSEVENIEKVSKGNVETVKISPPPIDSVKCGNDTSLSCSGFLESSYIVGGTKAFFSKCSLTKPNYISTFHLMEIIYGFFCGV